MKTVGFHHKRPVRPAGGDGESGPLSGPSGLRPYPIRPRAYISDRAAARGFYLSGQGRRGSCLLEMKMEHNRVLRAVNAMHP